MFPFATGLHGKTRLAELCQPNCSPPPPLGFVTSRQRRLFLRQEFISGSNGRICSILVRSGTASRRAKYGSKRVYTHIVFVPFATPPGDTTFTGTIPIFSPEDGHCSAAWFSMGENFTRWGTKRCKRLRDRGSLRIVRLRRPFSGCFVP